MVLKLMQNKAPVTLDNDLENLVYRVMRNLCADTLPEKIIWIPYAKALLKKFPDQQSASFSTLQDNLVRALKDLGEHDQTQRT